jgi:hypothetical protein
MNTILQSHIVHHIVCVCVFRFSFFTCERGVVGVLGELVGHEARQHLGQHAGFGGVGDGLWWCGSVVVHVVR